MTQGELIVIGLLLWFWRRSSPDYGHGWVWPVPDIAGGDQALISNGFSEPRHMGSDIMYRNARGYYAAEFTPVLSAHAGVVRSFGHTARGWNVVIDGDDGRWSTFYQHLDDVEPWVRSGATVRAGHRIGVMGIDPTDPQQVRHLHFELWPGTPAGGVWRRPGRASSAVDPAPMLSRATRQLWTP